MKKYLISFLSCIAFAFLFQGTCFATSVGNNLVPFKAMAMSGETVDLKKLTKKQPVMLFFWASW